MKVNISESSQSIVKIVSTLLPEAVEAGEIEKKLESFSKGINGKTDSETIYDRFIEPILDDSGKMIVLDWKWNAIEVLSAVQRLLGGYNYKVTKTTYDDDFKASGVINVDGVDYPFEDLEQFEFIEDVINKSLRAIGSEKSLFGVNTSTGDTAYYVMVNEKDVYDLEDSEYLPYRSDY